MDLNAARFYESWRSHMSAMKSLPGGNEIGKAFGPFFQGLMSDSPDGLSVKHKELIATAIAVAVRCDACIYSHVEKCLLAGATPREIMDASAVAVMMGGGPAYTYTTLVASALNHLTRASEGAHA